MTIKSNPCKLCHSNYHTMAFCPQKPRKPIKSKQMDRNLTTKKKKVSKKTKTISRSQLVKLLDSVFSKYIRYSATDSDGLVSCVTCLTRLEPKFMQNGHYYSRGKYPTRWHEDNCHPQCMRCNIYLKGNYTEYAIYMFGRYGADYVEELRELSLSQQKITTIWIKEQIELYKSKLKGFTI